MKQGWERKQLMEVCEQITDGSHFSPKSSGEAEYPYITVRDIDSDIIDFDNCKFINKKDYQSLLKNGCKPNFGDLLFSKDGTVGKVSLVDFEKDFVVLSSLAIIRPKSKIIASSLLKYILKDPSFLETAIGMKTGVAIRRIILKNLKQIEICFPKSFPEQQRIVAILDEAFAAIAKAKANAEQNLKNAKELFESVLNGQFTMDNGQLKEGWEEKTLVEITTKIGSGATPKGGSESYKTEGVSLVRSMNVHDFEFRKKNLAFIDDQQAKELNNVTLQENDVLLNITGASVARCCVIPKEFLPARVNQHVSIIRAKKEIIDPNFLNLLLTSKFYKDQLLFTGEQGATRQAITKAQLEVFSIAFPKSLKEQKSLMNKLDSISTETKKLEAVYQQKINDLDELKKSILQKAFSGELKTEKAIMI